MISQTACILERWIDDYIEALQSNDSVVRRNVKSLIVTNGVRPREAKEIATHFGELLQEIDDVLDKTDDALVEGWSYLNTTKLKRLRSYLELIVEEFTIKGTVTRRKRKVSPEKMVKSLKYLSEFDGKLESVNPTQIIGAKSVLLYNVKQRKISVYLSDEGLTVKGSTLKNFNSATVKSCGRKDYKWIKMMTVCPKMRMLNEINILKAREQEATGRINKDTLILRTMR